MADVAAAAGVSYQTVSRVVNDHPHVAARTRLRVQQTIRDLGYRPNASAHALATGRTRTLGLVTVDPHEYGPMNTLAGVGRVARSAGYAISLTVVDRADAAALQRAVTDLDHRSVAAILVVSAHVEIVSALHGVLAGVPVVGVRGPIDPGQREGASLITQHLLDLGHETVHHIAGPAASLDARDRMEGWSQTLRAAGRPVPAPMAGDWSAASGHRAGRVLAGRAPRRGREVARPSAVFAAGDQMALGAVRAFVEAGLSVPGDISIAGFDDQPGSAYVTPALTTVRQDHSGLGERAAIRALALVRAPVVVGGEHHRPVLVPRRSTGPPRTRPWGAR